MSSVDDSGDDQKKPKRHKTSWEWLVTILGIIGAAGTLTGILGRAFYVTRGEYTEKVIADTAEKIETQGQLRQINIRLIEYGESQNKLGDKLDEMSKKLSEAAARPR